MSICGRWQYDQYPAKHVYVENKEPHYTESLSAGMAVVAECYHAHHPRGYSGDVGFRRQARHMPPPLQISVKLTSKNSTQRARRTQAEILAKAGYCGPIKAGEVKALKNLLGKLGKTDHVVHGWILKDEHSKYSSYVRKRVLLHGPCYLFKSPIPGLDFKDFIMLARMYRDGGSLKAAVGELLKRVPSELRTEAETFRTIDVLAGLGETA